MGCCELDNAGNTERQKNNYSSLAVNNDKVEMKTVNKKEP